MDRVIRFFEPFSSLTFYSCHLLCHNAHFFLFLCIFCSTDGAHDEIIEGYSGLLDFHVLPFATLGDLRLIKRLTIVKLCKGLVFVLDLVLEMDGKSTGRLREGFLEL